MVICSVIIAVNLISLPPTIDFHCICKAFFNESNFVTRSASLKGMGDRFH